METNRKTIQNNSTNTDSPDLISVVLPTRNRAHCLRRSIYSVLAQSYNSIELIVVDDCSEDETAEFVANIPDSRVRYVRLATHSGVSVARNQGVKAARGELIAFQDSDDEWRLDKLRLMQKALNTNNEKATLVMCGDIVLNDFPSSYIGVRSHHQVVDFNTMVWARVPGASCWLVSRTAFLNCGGFDEDMDCFEDWELCIRLSKNGRTKFVNAPLTLRTRTQGSLFRNEERYAYNMSRLLERHQTELQRLPQYWSKYCNLVGQSNCQFGSVHSGREWIRRAIAANPSALRGWLNLLISHFGTRVFNVYLKFGRAFRRRFLPQIKPSLAVR